MPPLPEWGAQPVGALPVELREAAVASRHEALPERMKAISAVMLDTPHLDDPLGEGTGHDLDPLARYDMYDCLTFVEEVFALSLAGDPEHAAEVRLDLRYDGAEPEYVARRHFMELQWLPANIERGWLRDTTTEYGPTVRMERTVEPALWKNWAGRANFAMTDEQLPLGDMVLDVLTLDEAIAAAPNIRPGSMIAAVREDRSYKPIWITHVGLVFADEDGSRTLRHASRMKSSLRVRDHDLVWYLQKLQTYKNWKVAGIAVFEPIDAGPRAFAEPAGG
ncbi:MAG: DUF1460 domain-containing protein [Deltaproteobacteria bacterium]|nr:MAG: DUF1460 domain-containing protein [Deltaproteobacteria bacterium]